MQLSYNWLKEYVALPSPEKLAELLTFHTAEVESIEKRGKDWLLNIDILPNRAHDLNSYFGMAREIALIAKSEIKDQPFDAAQGRKSKIIEDKTKKTTDMLSVKIEDINACPRYIGRYIEGVKVGPSPKWLRERLEAVGQKSINNVVDATNYVMRECGQPLHAFDASHVESVQILNPKSKILNRERKEIVVRRAKKGEKFATLDGEKFTLDGSELLIADNKKPLALAGIKGGKESGISAHTKNLILEAANFDPALVRKTSKKLGIASDSAKQFGGGLHPALAERAMARLAALIQQLAGGAVYKGATDAYPKPWKPQRVLFDLAHCRVLLGADVKEAEATRILKVLGATLTKGDDPGEYLVLPPPERLDLGIPEDLYEEIGRTVGWNNIISRPPQAALGSREEHPVFGLASKVRGVLTGFGYSEHVGYSLIEETTASMLRKSGYSPVELANPIQKDMKYIRPTLVPSLLKAVAANSRRHEKIRLFEIGKIFSETAGDIQEQWSLGIAVFLKKEKFAGEAWSELKGALDALLDGFSLPHVAWKEFSEKNAGREGRVWRPSHGGEILLDNELLGQAGAVSEKLLAHFDITGTVAVAELDLASLLAQEVGELEFADIPRYPSVRRDISVVVPLGVKVEQVENCIQREGGEMLWDVDLLDAFSDERMGEERESLTFRLVFQHHERTLKDAEVNALMAKIVQALEKEGWEVKK